MSFEQPSPTPETTPAAPREYPSQGYRADGYQNPPREYPPREYPPREYPAARVSPTERTCQLVYLVFGIIEALILIRIVLKLLAANPNAGFTSFIYSVSQPFVAFFQGVFPVASSRDSVLELSSVLAIIVYALLAYLIVRVVLLLSRRRTPDAL